MKQLKKEILIVDDKPTDIQILSKILTEEGYIVREALNGKIALRSIQTNPPDLIILDILMPKMNGYEVCEKLKSDEKHKRIPIVFLTVLNEAIDKVKAFNLGCADYISKPFELEEVIIRIKNQLLIQQQQEQLIFQNLALQEEIRREKQLKKYLLSAIQELERLSMIDSLTKIPNRYHFDQYLEQEWCRLMREQLPLSLILCDIDYFKNYNDYYGHLAGDHCLTDVAQLLSRCVKRATDLLARYGGEEFAIILPNTPMEGAIQMGKLMLSIVEQAKIPHQASLVKPYVTVSLGVNSLIPNGNNSIEQLIKQTDEALYRSKEKGRNQITVVTG
jgi:diguanylate cyclase (GGDEF)-like protein